MRRKVSLSLLVLLVGIAIAACGGGETVADAPGQTAAISGSEAVQTDCSRYKDREIASLEVASDGRYKYVGKITDPLKLDAGVRYTICVYGTVKSGRNGTTVTPAGRGALLAIEGRGRSPERRCSRLGVSGDGVLPRETYQLHRAKLVWSAEYTQGSDESSIYTIN